MLEEINVPPRLGDRVMHRASAGFALRALEAAAWLEVEPDVEALLGRVEVR